MSIYSKNRPPRRARGRILALSILALCLCILSGTTLAYLVTGTDPIANLFSPGQVSCEVISGEDVTIQNTGTVDAYIRAAVVVSWVNGDGVVSANTPEEGTDYTIAYAGNTGWKKAEDGFWYYTAPVAPEQSTGVLIDSCNTTRKAPPKGYILSVEVVASAIQATPDDVVTKSWGSGVSAVSSSKLTIKEVQP